MDIEPPEKAVYVPKVRPSFPSASNTIAQINAI
jgi:hypothetical protein